MEAQETRKPESLDPGVGCGGIPRPSAYLIPPPRTSDKAALVRELRELAQRWRRVKKLAWDMRDSDFAAGLPHRASAREAEAVVIDLFVADLERLIQRCEGGEG